METKDDSSEYFLENSTLYVGDLDSTVEENELLNIFNQITDDVYSVKICRDRNTSSSLGYGYVNFKDSSQAEAAMKMLNFKKLKGKAMRIMFSERNPSKRISGRGNVFVKNLHESIDNEQLSNIFSQFDKVISAKVARDAYGVSKGYGFVQFQSELLVNIACDVYNGKLVCNQHIQVCPFISRHQWDTSPVFTNVYVKNLSKTVTEDDLKSLFGGFGEITSAVVMRDGEGKSKRFGFVNFDKSEAAVTAIEKMNGQRVDEGNELYVGRAQKKKNRVEELKAKFELRRIERASKGLNLYVKNLDSYVDKIKLEKVFSVFGTIISCKVMVDSNRMSKGVGFIEFSTSDEASKAMVEMNGKIVGNKPIYVSFAKCKEEPRLHLQTQFNSIPQNVVTPAPTFYQHSILNQVAAPWTMLPPQPPFTAYNLEPFRSRLQNGFPPMRNPYFLMPQPAAPPLGLGLQPLTGVYHCCNHSHGHPIHMFQ